MYVCMYAGLCLFTFVVNKRIHKQMEESHPRSINSFKNYLQRKQ